MRRAEAQAGERQRLERREILAGHDRVRHDHKALAQSATLFANGPIELSVVLKGNAPAVGTRWRLGLKPTMPHSAAGMRTEPPVSLPMAISHMRSPTRPRRQTTSRRTRAVVRLRRRAEADWR